MDFQKNSYVLQNLYPYLKVDQEKSKQSWLPTEWMVQMDQRDPVSPGFRDGRFIFCL